MWIRFTVGRWEGKELAHRLALLIHGISEIRPVIEGRKWHLGLTAQYTLERISGDTYRLASRAFGDEEYRQALEVVIAKVLRAKVEE